jgi:predicted TIM-barrel fold metal-dependent hydrolase
MRKPINRRTFLMDAGLVGAGALALAASAGPARAQDAVPNSAGTEPPRTKAPANACDCHHHIYDAARFPASKPEFRMQTNAGVADYRRLQARIGTARDVIVTPAPYVTDNRVTLDAIAMLGPRARGIAVVHPDISDAELKRLDAGGIRGIRFTLFDPRTAVTSMEMIEPLSRRIALLGWHVQLHLRADQISAEAAMLNRLPSAIVFDHIARMPEPAGTNDPAFGVVRGLIDKGRTWVKLSGAYLDTKIGPPHYSDVGAVARAFVAAAPERLVWGSDWPHPTERVKPDDAVLFDLLAEWAPDEAVRHRILVENPEALYGFPNA